MAKQENKSAAAKKETIGKKPVVTPPQKAAIKKLPTKAAIRSKKGSEKATTEEVKAEKKTAQLPHPIYGKEKAKEPFAAVEAALKPPIVTLIKQLKIDVTLLPKNVYESVKSFVEIFNKYIESRDQSIFDELKEKSIASQIVLDAWLDENNRRTLLQQALPPAESLPATVSPAVAVQQRINADLERKLSHITPMQNSSPTHQPHVVPPHHTYHEKIEVEMDNAAKHVYEEVMNNWRMGRWGYVPEDVVRIEILGRVNPKFKYEFKLTEDKKRAVVVITHETLPELTTPEFKVEP